MTRMTIGFLKPLVYITSCRLFITILEQKAVAATETSVFIFFKNQRQHFFISIIKIVNYAWLMATYF